MGIVVGRDIESINSYLDRNKKRKLLMGMIDVSGRPVTPEWQDYVPSTLSYQKPEDSGILQRMQDEVGARDQEVTNNVLVQAANRKNKALYEQQARMAAIARRNSVKLLNDRQISRQAGQLGTPTFQSNVQDPGMANYDLGSSPKPGKIVMINSHGYNVQVNASVANRFKGFLDALWRKGYHFKSLGGYNVRNIAGTNVRSLHSIGYAIDIDPTKNPTASIKQEYVYALPPNVGALAAKYGLSWGGNWRTYKDFMHFSVPYGGRE